MSGYVIEPLAGHDRSGFDSGSEPLDRYFRQNVSQDMRRRLANCFVAVGQDGGLAGFYTLAATSISSDRLAAEQVRTFPRYPAIPAILLGRLAVARDHQGRRLGSALLADAVARSRRSEAAAHFLVVDAIDEAAARFYHGRDFKALPDDPHRLVRLLRTP